MVYVDEKTNQDSYIVNKLKHALGFPMMYFLDEEKKLLNIQKIETHHSSETLSNSYNIHFNSLSKGVSLIIADLDRKGLLKDDTDTEALKEKEAEDEEVGEDGRTAEERRIDEEYEKYKREKDSLRNLLRDKN